MVLRGELPLGDVLLLILKDGVTQVCLGLGRHGVARCEGVSDASHVVIGVVFDAPQPFTQVEKAQA